MTDRPIIFIAPMIRALLDGRKIMTRRLAWQDVPCRLVQPKITPTDKRGKWVRCKKDHPEAQLIRKPTPWQSSLPGDRLWVKETWKPHSLYASMKPRDVPKSKVFYRADKAFAPSNTPWRSPIFTLRWASRLTLVVTAVKIERLQDITLGDVVMEGVKDPFDMRKAAIPGPAAYDAWEEKAIYAFQDLWRSLHGPDAWDANPELVALTFAAHNCNIDDEEYPPRIRVA